jgi:hypothetical protein
MVPVDELAAELAVKRRERRVTGRPHTPAEPMARLEDANLRSEA